MIRMTYEDSRILIENGFTLDEISAIDNAETSDGDPQPQIDLNEPYWQEGMEIHREVRDNFVNNYLNEHPHADPRYIRGYAYSDFINRWRTQEDIENDPAIWIRIGSKEKAMGHLTREQLNAAYEKVERLRASLNHGSGSTPVVIYD